MLCRFLTNFIFFNSDVSALKFFKCAPKTLLLLLSSTKTAQSESIICVYIYRSYETQGFCRVKIFKICVANHINFRLQKRYILFSEGKQSFLKR